MTPRDIAHFLLETSDNPEQNSSETYDVDDPIWFLDPETAAGKPTIEIMQQTLEGKLRELYDTVSVNVRPPTQEYKTPLSGKWEIVWQCHRWTVHCKRKVPLPLQTGLNWRTIIFGWLLAWAGEYDVQLSEFETYGKLRTDVSFVFKTYTDVHLAQTDLKDPPPAPE